MVIIVATVLIRH